MILENSLKALKAEIEKTENQILREGTFGILPNFPGDPCESTAAEYLEDLRAAHAEVIRMLGEVDRGEAELFARDVADFLKNRKRAAGQ